LLNLPSAVNVGDLVTAVVCDNEGVDLVADASPALVRGVT